MEDFDGFLYRKLSYKIRGILYDIRNKYGPGHKENVYSNLIEESCKLEKIYYDREKRINIYSDETKKIIGIYIPDFVIEDKIILEIKASRELNRYDHQQIYHYLRNSQHELGLLINFGTPELYIKRIVYSNYKKPFLKQSV